MKAREPAQPDGSNRPIPAQKKAIAATAPILWKFASGNKWAGGLFIDDQHCWVGNDATAVFALNHQGKVQKRFQLPSCDVDSLASDGERVFAVCGGGGIYDLSERRPRLAYAFYQVSSLAFWGKIMVVSGYGRCFAMGPDDRVLWRKKTKGCGSICCDHLGAYHLYGNDLIAYGLENGDPLWKRELNGNGRTTWQTKDRIYADSGAGGQVLCVDKKTGKVIGKYILGEWIFSCASSPDGTLVFAASNTGHLYGFAENGDQLWRLSTKCGTALRMCFWQDRLYMVTTGGVLACLDVGDESIRAARARRFPKAKVIEAPKGKGIGPAANKEAIHWMEWP